jgi:GAF domain-containing protein
VLEIGPYQSDILATAHILIGKGVCGTCWETKQTRLINRVRECKNYIACDNVTKAELCVPVFNAQGEVKAVFDIDSLTEDCFCKVD